MFSMFQYDDLMYLKEMIITLIIISIDSNEEWIFIDVPCFLIFSIKLFRI